MRAWVESRAHLEALLLGTRDEVLRVTVDLLAWLGLGLGSAYPNPNPTVTLTLALT